MSHRLFHKSMMDRMLSISKQAYHTHGTQTHAPRLSEYVELDRYTCTDKSLRYFLFLSNHTCAHPDEDAASKFMPHSVFADDTESGCVILCDFTIENYLNSSRFCNLSDILHFMFHLFLSLFSSGRELWLGRYLSFSILSEFSFRCFAQSFQKATEF